MNESRRNFFATAGIPISQINFFGPENIDSFINVKSPQYGARGDGRSDDTDAFLRAIYFANRVAIKQDFLEKNIPVILVPAGRYVLNKTLSLKPWIKLVSMGPVVLDWSGAGHDIVGVQCDNSGQNSFDKILKNSSGASPFLCGDFGTISLLGPGKDLAVDSVGLKLGNFSKGSVDFRLAKISNIQFSGWGVANHIGSVNTYLFSAVNCHYEINGISIKTESGRQHNSGEKMTWLNCVFSGCRNVLDVNTDSFDVDFSNCSFDYIGNVVFLRESACYLEIKFISCHIEAVDNYFVDAALVNKSIDFSQIGIYLVAVDVLTTGWLKKTSGISGTPGKMLFRGPISISIFGFKRDVIAQSFEEDGYIFDSSVRLVTSYSEPTPVFVSCPGGQFIVNSDFDFSYEKPTDIPKLMNYWESNTESINKLHVSKFFSVVDEKHVLNVSGHDSDGGVFTKQKYPCRPGDIFGMDFAANFDAIERDAKISIFLVFFDVDKNPLESAGRNEKYLTVKVDEFRGRYVSLGAKLVVVPSGAFFVRLSLHINSLFGLIKFSRLRLWRQ